MIKFEPILGEKIALSYFVEEREGENFVAGPYLILILIWIGSSSDLTRLN